MSMVIFYRRYIFIYLLSYASYIELKQ